MLYIEKYNKSILLKKLSKKCKGSNELRKRLNGYTLDIMLSYINTSLVYRIVSGYSYNPSNFVIYMQSGVKLYYSYFHKSFIIEEGVDEQCRTDGYLNRIFNTYINDSEIFYNEDGINLNDDNGLAKIDFEDIIKIIFMYCKYDSNCSDQRAIDFEHFIVGYYNGVISSIMPNESSFYLNSGLENIDNKLMHLIDVEDADIASKDAILQCIDDSSLKTIESLISYAASITEPIISESLQSGAKLSVLSWDLCISMESIPDKYLSIIINPSTENRDIIYEKNDELCSRFMEKCFHNQESNYTDAFALSESIINAVYNVTKKKYSSIRLQNGIIIEVNVLACTVSYTIDAECSYLSSIYYELEEYKKEQLYPFVSKEGEITKFRDAKQFEEESKKIFDSINACIINDNDSSNSFCNYGTNEAGETIVLDSIYKGGKF